MEFLRQQFPRQQLGQGIASIRRWGLVWQMHSRPVNGVLYEIGAGDWPLGLPPVSWPSELC